jgi:hypothetical protein
MKVPRFRKNRIKEIKNILKILETYPEVIKNSKYHEYRVSIYEWLLAYEEGRAACTPQERLDIRLRDFYGQLINKADPLDVLITISVLYSYVHNREYSNL